MVQLQIEPKHHPAVDIMVEQELTASEFAKAQALIYQMSGIRISANKQTLLNNRIRRRLRAGDYPDFASYLKLIESDPQGAEVTALLNEITTNETSFFRTPKHFDWLSHDFIPELIAQARQGLRKRQIRVWSAAASTGEEPYSIAICFAENRLRLQGWELEIIGTDLDQNSLDRARQGIFGERAISSLDPKRQKRYFKKLPEEPRWQINDSIRQMVVFQHHNLIHPWESHPFDCVFLRNVLIYFDRESKQRVIHHLTNAIRHHGYLVVGPSEGVFDLLPGFSKQSTFLYQKQ